MLIEHAGKRPSIADSAFVAPTAVVCGDVRIGANSRVLFGAVIVHTNKGKDVVVPLVKSVKNLVLRDRECRRSRDSALDLDEEQRTTIARTRSNIETGVVARE